MEQRIRHQAGSVPPPKAIEISMLETLRKFEILVRSLDQQGKSPSAEINLLAEFKDRETLEAHLKNLQKAIDTILATDPKKIFRLSREKRTIDHYPVNDSIVSGDGCGTSVFCAKHNLVNNYFQHGMITSDPAHMLDSMRIMHAWARINNIKKT